MLGYLYFSVSVLWGYCLDCFVYSGSVAGTCLCFSEEGVKKFHILMSPTTNNNTFLNTQPRSKHKIMAINKGN